jgi:hypothetical protein
MTTVAGISGASVDAETEGDPHEGGQCSANRQVAASRTW